MKRTDTLRESVWQRYGAQRQSGVNDAGCGLGTDFYDNEEGQDFMMQDTWSKWWFVKRVRTGV